MTNKETDSLSKGQGKFKRLVFCVAAREVSRKPVVCAIQFLHEGRGDTGSTGFRCQGLIQSSVLAITGEKAAQLHKLLITLNP